MCKDMDGRDILPGDYVERVNGLNRSVWEECAHPGNGPYRVLTVRPYGIYLDDALDDDQAFDHRCFRVVDLASPSTVRQMSYKILQELEKCRA